MKAHTDYILSLQCQVTLATVKDCPCMKCVLWRVQIATEEQEEAEAKNAPSWLTRWFGKRVKA